VIVVVRVLKLPLLIAVVLLTFVDNMELAMVIPETLFVGVPALQFRTHSTNIPAVLTISAGAGQFHAPFVASMILVARCRKRFLLSFKDRTFRTIQVGSASVANN
jgi:hypothetical protein